MRKYIIDGMEIWTIPSKRIDWLRWLDVTTAGLVIGTIVALLIIINS